MAAKRLWATWVCAAGTVLGCGSQPTPGAGGDGVGTIRVALSSAAGSTTYVLANASFGVTPVQPTSDAALFLHQSDSTAGDVTTIVAVGRYSVNLLDGWQLEREDSPTTLVPVHATLQSANPITVSVFSGQTTTVTFQFQTDGIPLTFGPGSIDIGIQTGTCDAAPPPGVELNVISNPDFEQNLDGWLPTTLTRSGVAHCGTHSLTFMNDTLVRYALPSPDVQTFYAFSAWMKVDAPTQFEGLLYSDEGMPDELGYRFLAQSLTPEDWVHVSATGVRAGGPGYTSAGLVLVSYTGSDGAPVQVWLDDVYLVPQ